ncbi:tripartite tricarboxylate transporter substrate-binding protein [Pseudomonas sp. NPDC007930]|uniref:tripartite tricarboxylate transporter substrate-binding protein n=1 Tax=Pseudomonas sp. NPDC007930 TaxID=3364417 RepID=UPI0036EF18B0
MHRRTVLAGLGLAGLATMARGWAESNAPTHGTVVFGAAKGAIGSTLAELTLAQLRRDYQLDYSLVINDARNSRAAVESVQHAKPDGATLLQAQSSSIVLFPSTYKALGYDPVKDFAPLTILGTYGYSLVLGAAVPANVTTVQGYLDWVERNPDQRDVGFSLYGSQAHLLSVMLARESGTAVRPQGYGSANSIFNDLASGAIGAAFTVNGNVPLLARAGVRAVAITDPHRLGPRPDVRTFAESGLAALNLTGWYGWFAPSSTPTVVLNDQAIKLGQMTVGDEYTAQLNSLLLERNTASPAEIAVLMQREIAQYAELTKSYRLSVST